MNRLKTRYQKEVVPALKKEFGYTNVMAIPKVEKVVINMGLGEATSNAKIADVGADELSRITGQKAMVRRATKSIAQFKLRQGMPVGAMVTLRGERMCGIPRPPDLDRAAARARLPRRLAEGLRRPRQLHPGPAGPAAVPRDRLHEGRQGARHERVDGDDGEDGRGSTQAAATARHAVPDELRWLKTQGSRLRGLSPKP